MEKKFWQILAFGAAMTVCIQPVSARQLSANEALTRAVRSELSAPAGMRKAPVASRMKLVHTSLTEKQNIPALYVFASEKNDGFIVASADDRLQPVLGVADSGSFSEIPENMQWWLDQYEEEIAAYYDANGTDGTASEYQSVYDLYDSWAPIEPICKTTWDQGAPYNDLCPDVVKSDEKGKTVTGCVATCLAQAIKAIGYLNPGGGTKVHKNENLGWEVSFDYDNYKPDFSKLRDKYDGNATQAEKDEVAKLMMACGIAVNSNYRIASVGGTGADYVADGISKYLGFNQSFRLRRDGMTTKDWETAVYSVLKAGRPLCYGGSGSGGHAFICDGYSEDGLFHFNWGWSGTANGYFRLSVLDPRHIGTGGFAGGYSHGQNAFVLVSDKDKEIRTSLAQPGIVRWDSGKDIPLRVNCGVDKTGMNYINLNLRYFLTLNYVGGVIPVGIGLLLRNRAGGEEDIYLAPDMYANMQEGFGVYDSMITFDKSRLPYGTEYDAYPVYTFDGYDGYWRCLPTGAVETGKDHWLVSVDSNGELKCSVADRQANTVGVFDMSASDIYSTDNLNKFRCLITNYSDVEDFQKTLTLRLCKPDGTKVSEIAKTWIYLPAGETTVIDLTFTTKGVDAGKYTLGFYDEGTNALLTENATLDVEVIDGKRPDDGKVVGPMGYYEVSFWVNGARQAMAPMKSVAGGDFSGVTSVTSNMSVAADYSLAFFKHGETYNPIAKFHIYSGNVQTGGYWQEGTPFTVKHNLPVGVYTMAFVDQYETVVSYSADFLVGAEKDGIIYDFDAESGALTVAGARGAVPAEIKIPTEVEGYPVVAVADGAFDHCSALESVFLPSSIKSIGLNAFRGASSLRHVTFGSKDVPFANAAVAFGNVNPSVQYYVDAAAFDAYNKVFTYRGKLYASISELKLPDETSGMVGTSNSVTIEVAPTANYNPEFTVEVADPSVATAEIVDGKVVITSRAEGETTLTVTSAQPGVAPATMKVKVEGAPVIPVEITISKTSLELVEGETAELEAEMKNAPEGAIVAWTSSDEKVATVNADGKVTAVGVGEAVITASYGDAKASCTVNVASKGVTYGLDLRASEVTLDEGGTFQLWYNYTGETKDVPDDEEVVYSTSDASIATVSANGLITAVKAGEAVISATCIIGGVSATCAVTVKGTVTPPPAPEYDLKLSETSVELTEGETKALTCEFTGEAPKDAKIVWTSSNEAVATVKDGIVTAVKAGEAVITATCGDKSATCDVKVNAKPVPPTPEYGLQLSETSIELKEGESKVIGYEFTGEAPEDAELVWTSSNETVAMVENGVVTAVKAGNAVVTATCGTASASCAVVVVADGTGDDDPSDAIAEVEADASARYFDLSGRRIASPRGVCIELKNGVARKVMVK